MSLTTHKKAGSEMLMLTIVRDTFGRTKSGKSWCTKPVESTIETMPWYRQDGYPFGRYGEEAHRKITEDDTLRWFRRLGGSEYVERSYTPAGYLVTRLISTSPNRTMRQVRTFRFSSV